MALPLLLWSGMMRLFAIAVGVSSSAAVAGAAPLVRVCPEYTAHMLRARAALVRQDRMTAIAELREAQLALDACTVEDATDAAGSA